MKQLFSTLLIFLLITGCSTQKGNENMMKNMSNVNVKDTSEALAHNQKTANHLIYIASSIPNVKRATAVVIGPYAVVGIEVNGNLERSRVENIKYTVAQSLKRDPQGANAVVVADPNVNERLKQMGKEIRKGNTNGVMEELAAIVGRIMPQLPNDVLDQGNQEPIKKSNEQLPENNKTKLQNEQEKQSNDQMRR